MAEQNNPGEAPTEYTWQTTIQTATGQTMNGFWYYLVSGDETSSSAVLGSTSFPSSAPITTEGGSDEYWTFLYLDSSNNLWVPNDWQTKYNAPEYNGSLTIQVDTTGTITLTFTYSGEDSPLVYTITGFKSFVSLTGSA